MRLINQASRIKVLVMIGINLSTLNSQLLAETVSNIEEVVFNYCELTPYQANAIFAAIHTDSKIKKLDVGTHVLTDVSLESIAGAVAKLEKLMVDDTSLTDQQVNMIFSVINTNTNMKGILDLTDNDLSSVKPAVLAKSVIKLEVLNLSGTFLSTKQLEAIFMSMCGESKLNILMLSDNNLSSVNPELLAKAITNLSNADVSNADLTPEQLTTVFEAIDQGCRLKKLNIGFNDISLVDPILLSRVKETLSELNAEQDSSNSQEEGENEDELDGNLDD